MDTDNKIKVGDRIYVSSKGYDNKPEGVCAVIYIASVHFHDEIKFAVVFDDPTLNVFTLTERNVTYFDCQVDSGTQLGGFYYSEYEVSRSIADTKTARKIHKDNIILEEDGCLFLKP